MPRRENRRGGRRRSARTGPGQGRQPADQDARLKAPTTIYSSDDGGDLELRGSLNLKARSEYAAVLTGGLDREDAYQRATELLFEHLAVSWTISGLRIDHQRELLGRYRMASPPERQFVRESLRRHLAENFPEMQAP
jgi:hypothetical protein